MLEDKEKDLLTPLETYKEYNKVKRHSIAVKSLTHVRFLSNFSFNQ
jgi:hypothetical protein